MTCTGMCGSGVRIGLARTTTSHSPPNDPTGPAVGSDRVLRGGDWHLQPVLLPLRVSLVPRARHPLPLRWFSRGLRGCTQSGGRDTIAKSVSNHFCPQCPSPAVAPFDAAKAKEHQEAWAKHLAVPVEQTNSIGMKLVLIPPGEFDMGSTPEEIASEIEKAKKLNALQTDLDQVAERGSTTSGEDHQAILLGDVSGDAGRNTRK